METVSNFSVPLAFRFTHPDLDTELGEAKFFCLWQNKDGS
jgi:hypothetical protein